MPPRSQKPPATELRRLEAALTLAVRECVRLPEAERLAHIRRCLLTGAEPIKLDPLPSSPAVRPCREALDAIQQVLVDALNAAVREGAVDLVRGVGERLAIPQRWGMSCSLSRPPSSPPSAAGGAASSPTPGTALSVAPVTQQAKNEESVSTEQIRVAPGLDSSVALALASSILGRLHGATARPPLPIRAHGARLPSGRRGLSRAALRALRGFFEAHGALGKLMADVCKEAGSATSVCALTLSTGLSLAESIVVVGGGGGEGGSGGDPPGTLALVGPATTFFSYSWTGTKLGEMLDAIERTLAALEASDGRTRYAWVDMFCASQNLLAGVYRDPAVTREADPAGYAARKEDTDRIFEDALEAVDEILLYCSPLTGEWLAPSHPHLLPGRGEPPAGWVRRGPGAMTRAWCMFELVKALAKGCTLHVVLNQADVDGFEGLLRSRFDEIADVLGRLDARDAQISKVEDRAYILGEVEKLDGGLGQVTKTVCGAVREWLAEEGRAAVRRVAGTAEGRSASSLTLINQVGALLNAQGRLGEAEPLYVEALEGYRETLGDRHASTLASINNLGLLLKNQGRLGEAEPLYVEALEGRRETLGDRHPSTLTSINNLGMLLQAQGRLGEAEPLLVEAQARAPGDASANAQV
jgi:tetratricopeptide (TPR) repeat protein